MKTLADAAYRKRFVEREIADETNRHNCRIVSLKLELASCEEVLSASAEGLDVDMLADADAVLTVGDHYGPYGDQDKMVARAIEDIALGCPTLRHSYFGTKNYGSFWHQGTSHNYGYGPRHGSMVWRIELTEAVRRRLCDGGELTVDEKEAAIYLLLNMKAIAKSRAAAKAAAKATAERLTP